MKNRGSETAIHEEVAEQHSSVETSREEAGLFQEQTSGKQLARSMPKTYMYIFGGSIYL
jgi:hypothetical protein